MSRAVKFKQSDVVRMLKAGKAVGIDFSVTVQPDGTLTFIRSDDKKVERRPPKGKDWPTL